MTAAGSRAPGPPGTGARLRVPRHGVRAPGHDRTGIPQEET